MRTFFIAGAFGILLVCVRLFVSAPGDFPIHSVVHIESGLTGQQAALLLEEKKVIASSLAFTFFSRVFGTIQAGSYALSAPESAPYLAYRFARGFTALDPVAVTIPEGATTREIAILLEEQISNFNAKHFREIAREHEGYLFPDTYFFLPGTTAEVVVERMHARFTEQFKTLSDELTASGRNERDIVIMASIIEREARQLETMKLVSGILWKRIEIGMPLQVDAVFGYIFDRPTFNPSFEDLETDSPYNTYKNKGLPPGPISNPGLNALRAALLPTKSPYLYYLTGSDGAMHYARSFEEHVANRRFLR